MANLVTISADNHYEKLVDGLWNYFLTKRGVDFDVEWGDRVIRAHRLILSIFLAPDKLIDTVADLHDCSPDPFLEFLYNGTVTVPEEHLPSLLKVARKSKFQLLVDSIEQCAPECKLMGDSELGDELNAGPQNLASTTYVNAVEQIEEVASVQASEEVWSVNTVGNASDLGLNEIELEGDCGISADGGFPGCENEEACDINATNRSRSDLTNYNRDSNITNLPRRLYRCSLCPYRTFCEQRLQFHEVCHNNVPVSDARPEATLEVRWYQCSQCPYKSTKKHIYEKHRAKHNASPIPVFRCPRCPAKFSEEDQLAIHTCRRWSGSPPHRCPHCNYSTRGVDEFRLHVAKHDANANHIHCQTCDCRFLDEDAFKQHSCELSADGVPLIRCPHCPARFLRVDQLTLHKCKRKGKGVTLHKCQLCDYTSCRTDHFRLHVAKHDASVTLKQCPACIRKFLDDDALRRHSCKLSVKGIQLHKCPHCPYTNKFANQLRYHVEGMHSTTKPYKCKEPGCNYAAGLKTSLRRHVEVVHLDRKLFVCEKCAYRTWNQSRLTRHQLVHSDVRIYGCDRCELTFRDHCTLKYHKQNKHAGGVPRSHVCHVCGSAFYRRDTLRTHLKCVHKTTMEVTATSV